MEIIILAGGFGTRLKSEVKDVPKPMADINGRPFLSIIVDKVKKYNPKKIIFSVGYKHEVIQEYFSNSYQNIDIDYSIEKVPLGTGGGIKRALSKCLEDDIMILNGDTIFDIDIDDFFDFHHSNGSDISIALKYLENFSRYGEVEIKNNHRIVSFCEKKEVKKGLINGGIYLLKKEIIEKYDKEKFSFETFLSEHIKDFNIMGNKYSSYFIDIGIPKDYLKFKSDFYSD